MGTPSQEYRYTAGSSEPYKGGADGNAQLRIYLNEVLKGTYVPNGDDVDVHLECEGGGGGGDNGIVYINPGTTQSEVNAIVSSGKLPVMQVVAGQGYNYFYPSWIGSGLTFVHISRYGVVVKMWDNQVGGWTDVAGYDTTLSSDSKNAVQNATLYAVIGNVETLLAAL